MKFRTQEIEQQAKVAIRTLELFAEQAQVEFDRPLGMRTIIEMVRSIPGDDYRIWGQRLVEAGESLNLRIRSSDMPLSDALSLIREGLQVAACITSNDGRQSSTTWLALIEKNGNRIRVYDVSDDTRKWMSVSELEKLLVEAAGTSELRWITGQPTLPCSPKAEVVDNRRIKPLERLFGIMRPDRSDLLAVITFSVVVGLLALATPIAIEALVNTVAFGRYLQPIVVLSIILMTFLGFGAAIRVLNSIIVEIVQRRLFVRVVEDLAYRLPRVEQSSLDRYYGPELVNRFFDVVTVQKVTAKLLLDGITLVLQTALGMAVLAFYHPFLLGFDIVLLLSIGFIVVVLGRNAVKTAIAESASKYQVAAWLQELLRNPSAFKLHGGAQYGLDQADRLTVKYLQARKSHWRIVIRQFAFALALQALAATVLLGLGGWLVIQGELNLGQLVAAELIVMNIVGSFAKIGKYVESFYDLLASVDKLGKLFDLPVETHDKLFHLEDNQPADLEIHAVTQKIGKTTLHNGLSFRAAPGQRIAITGMAGSGKSSLLDLITGVRHPTSGNVTLDQIDLRELRPDSLREHVSLARNVEIFNGTIAENVHLNRPHINASDVREALVKVGLQKDIMKLTDGLGTQIQTGGAPLSSSQSRRLMLARAIVNRPRLLLVDGVLDSASDAELDDLLKQLCGQNSPWTLLIATGRNEVANSCDAVLDLDTGKLKFAGDLQHPDGDPESRDLLT